MRKLNKSKAGIGYFLAIIMTAMFVFAFAGLFSNYMWNEFEVIINGTSESAVPTSVKEEISGFNLVGEYSDKLFVFSFILFIIAYLIIAVLTPKSNPFVFIFYAVMLVVITILAMMMSNVWDFITQHPDFVTAATMMPLTDYFMNYYPLINFFIGILGGLIFFLKSDNQSDLFRGGGNFDFQ